MKRKNHAFALAALLFVFAASTGGCSSSFTREPKPRIVAAADGGKEEVLDDDDDRDDFGRPKDTSPEGTVGGVLVSIGYLGVILGSAILPLLVFL